MRYFLEIEALERAQGKSEFAEDPKERAVIPQRLKRKRDGAIRLMKRSESPNRHRRDAPCLHPAYGLCPKTGTWHKLTVWDMAFGCIDCGWCDWSAQALADGRTFPGNDCVCTSCIDRSKEPVGLDDWPFLDWTERLARHLLKHPEARPHIAALAAFREKQRANDPDRILADVLSQEMATYDGSHWTDDQVDASVIVLRSLLDLNNPAKYSVRAWMDNAPAKALEGGTDPNEVFFPDCGHSEMEWQNSTCPHRRWWWCRTCGKHVLDCDGHSAQLPAPMGPEGCEAGQQIVADVAGTASDEP